MRIVFVDPIFLLGVILVALVFWLCIFLDNMFRRGSSRRRGKQRTYQRRKKHRHYNPKNAGRHIHIHLKVKK